MEQVDNATRLSGGSMVDETCFSMDELENIFWNVTPIPQDDGPELVCSIDYSPNFIKVYDYFRAILKSNELSPRVFGLTGLCLDQNPANYTVWHVRRLCFALTNWSNVEEKHAALTKELNFTAETSGSNPKNYQGWYHRRSLLERHADPLLFYRDSELAYLNAVLLMDGKNYHAWSHRQWLVSELNQTELYKAELEYTEQLLSDDIRNNSAWNHRWFILHINQQQPQRKFHRNLQLPDTILESEAKYALSQVQLDPYNESSCRYLVALLKNSFATTIPIYVDSLKATAVNSPDASSLLSALVDLFELQQNYPEAAHILTRLVSLDPIRTKYWLWRLNQITTPTEGDKSNI